MNKDETKIIRVKDLPMICVWIVFALIITPFAWLSGMLEKFGNIIIKDFNKGRE